MDVACVFTEVLKDGTRTRRGLLCFGRFDLLGHWSLVVVVFSGRGVFSVDVCFSGFAISGIWLIILLLSIHSRGATHCRKSSAASDAVETKLSTKDWGLLWAAICLRYALFSDTNDDDDLFPSPGTETDDMPIVENEIFPDAAAMMLHDSGCTHTSRAWFLCS